MRVGIVVENGDGDPVISVEVFGEPHDTRRLVNAAAAAMDAAVSHHPYAGTRTPVAGPQ